MIVLSFQVHLTEPLLATRLAGDPNSAISYPYLPGSAIRGALVERYQPTPGADLMMDAEARRLFFDGSTRYLNAYPLDRRGQRMLPAPLSWFYKKGDPVKHGATLYDFCRRIRTDGQYKSLGERFVWCDGREVELDDLAWQINIHTQREREKGRATESGGAVFRYEALAAGQDFGGVILASDEADAERLAALLSEEALWLGGSRSAGYGRVTITGTAVQEAGRRREIDNWTGKHALTRQAGKLVITLLSDTIVRDATGAFLDRLTPGVLGLPDDTASAGMFKRVVTVGGFNNKWGLPLPQTPAIQAGSVFVFEIAENALDPARLQTLEVEGIGERRVEGFGRAAVNWHGDDARLKVRDVAPSEAAPPVEELSEASADLARRMVGRLLRRDLDRLVAERIQSLRLDPERLPSRAQLSRLRNVVLNALPEHDVKAVKTFLDDLRPRAREQYREARVDTGNTRLLDWLTARLEAPAQGAFWTWLGVEAGYVRIGPVEAGLSTVLAQEYALRVIEGLLHRAAKEKPDA